MGVLIHSTRLMQPGEFALWSEGALVFSGQLGSRLGPMAFDAIAVHVDDGAVLWRRLGAGSHPGEDVLKAVAAWWECEG